VPASSLSAAVLFTNFGPYHVARAQGLRRVPCISATFIEIAAAERLYPWRASKDALGASLITLSQRQFEETSAHMVARKLRRTLDRLQPAVVVIAGYSEGAMRTAAYWARRHRAGVVIASETTRWDRPRTRWKEWAKSWWVRRFVDAAFVGGSPHRQYLASLSRNVFPIWEGYDCVDNDFFQTGAEAARRRKEVARKQLQLPDDYFLFVGRFAPEKNVETLLRAYAAYRVRFPTGPRLVLAGHGPDRARLERLALDLGLSDVGWPGFLPYEQLPQYYGLARCLVVPSVREPWGLVANEAAASRIPLVLSNACGCASELVIEGVNGFTCPPRDTGAWVDILAWIGRFSPSEIEHMGAVSADQVRRFSPTRWGTNLAEAAAAAAAAAGRRS
jgi:1,2-diacylglycerol 3-alpha-glucosyltransferase